MIRIRKALWKTFPKEKLLKIVEESFSYREVAEKIGYNPNTGSAIPTVKAMIKECGFDDGHFQGKSREKSVVNYSKFQMDTHMRHDTIQRALVLLRGRKCEMCGLSEWGSNPIPLEVHHVDGDSANNTLDNLMLLCRNCHGVTDNFKGKSNKARRCVSDNEFIEALKTSDSIYQALNKLGLATKGGNYKRAYDLACKHGIVLQK